MDDLDQLKTDLLAQVDDADLAALEDLRVAALGKSGTITEMVKGIGQLPPDERRDAGQQLNAVKNAVADAIDAKKQTLEAAALDASLSEDRIDVTLPARPDGAGIIHPISQTIDEMVAIFCEMGFTVAEGPHIETDFNNFTALNIPPEHPARQDHDTFYLPPGEDGERKVLRTHTSPVQIRTMLSENPPIRIVVPGRTFRADHDATHSPMFHQIEALVIDEAIHMGHLKGCLETFARTFEGGGLTIGAGADWLEILGCGMVNPHVLENCGIDSTKYQGFAFGLGIERAAMLKYGIPDLRTFYESDIRWLKHYGFAPLDVPNVAAGLVGGRGR